MNYKLGELFCGPGGIAVGARDASIIHNGEKHSITHEWANDYDKDTCETYARNICPENVESVFCEDVRNLDIKSLKPIDCFAFGFPCNDFSIVGEQKGFDGTFGPLYTYGIKVLNHFQPKFFIAENVGGLASANSGSAFKKILDDLRNAGNGYILTPHLYKSEDYNVPQSRHRIIIVGIDRTLNKRFKVPMQTSLNNPISAKEAIENPPISKKAFNNEIIIPSSTVVERLKLIKPGENVWNANLPKHLQLNVKSAKMSQIYKRLHPDKPSYTITGSGGGGTHGYHWSENRALTNRERARIQTFPDKHIFYGSKESVRKQIGMAVPAKLAEIIFNSILKTMLDIPYPFIEEKYKQVNELFENELIKI
jgi:DNA (cytosine-5)-methyltransferase 1